MDFIKELGHLALGSRLRRLSDRIMSSGIEIYGASGLDFEPRWFPVFRLVADRGPLTVGECAAELGLTHAAVSQTLRAMTKRGVMTAKRDRNDDRKRLLALTDAGRDLLPALQAVWSDIEAAVRDVVDVGGVDVFAALEGIEHALDQRTLAQRTEAHRRARLGKDVEIIDFEPRYREAFRTLNLEWLEKYFEVEPIDRELLWNPESILEGGGVILFARLHGEIVGTCALQRQGEACELIRMAVTERHQGRQIGKKLLTAALQRARAMGFGSVYLVTNSGLTPAVTLYRKAGFRVTHCGPNAKYRRGDLTMELDL